MIFAHGLDDEQRFAYARSTTEAIEIARRWSADGLTVEISDRSGIACPVERFIALHHKDEGA